MGKFSKSILVAALTLSLGACSATATPTEKVENESKLTLVEVFNKTKEAETSLESLHMDMTANQAMTNSMTNEVVTMETSSKADMVMEPLSGKITSIMNLSGAEDIPAEFSGFETEMYITENGIYMKESVQNQWSKFPAEFMDQFESMMMKDSLPKNQMEQLEPYLDSFTFEQDESSYILTLDLEGEKANEMLEQGLNVLPDELQGQAADMQENISIEAIKMVVLINKETFFTTQMDTETKMIMSIDGEEMMMDSSVKMTVKDHNNISEIIVPAEVVEQAVEMEF
ncbi:DUF6612 family protein [Bacillus sp. 2205SS5-2]|uniref:DUF6612 family protein n=1 Tax=Bacillus sp. 2205SS5-2 TaxID=3109031 RepID=UPI0030074FF1